MKSLINMWNEMGSVYRKLMIAGVLLLVVGVLTYRPARQQHNHHGNSLQAKLLGGKTFRAIEVSHRELEISPTEKGLEIELRDRSECHKSDVPCRAIIWQINPSGKFLSREEFYFQNGLKVWVGRIDAIGQREDYQQLADYGAGNPIPYVIQTYRDKPGDRRLFMFQEQVDTVLKEIPPAA